MPAGRPSLYDPAFCERGVEKVALDASTINAPRNGKINLKPHFSNESDWCKFIVDHHADWLPVLGKKPFEKHEFEVPLSIRGMRAKSWGIPRLDAVGWRDGKATIIETKINVSPASMLGGAGQLMYYAELAREWNDWDIEELVLISPAWPAYMHSVLLRYEFPISLVRIDKDEAVAVRSPRKP